jgi:hypothetical protein
VHDDACSQDRNGESTQKLRGKKAQPGAENFAPRPEASSAPLAALRVIVVAACAVLSAVVVSAVHEHVHQWTCCQEGVWQHSNDMVLVSRVEVHTRRNRQQCRYQPERRTLVCCSWSMEKLPSLLA